MMKIETQTPNQTMLSELGARLARVRKQNGYSQDSLAKNAGIGVATLRRIEDGKDSQLSSWLKLLIALEMTPSIDALLPESVTSPMYEVLGKNTHIKRQRDTVREDTQGKVIWGDEQ